ncbi:MarR family transcriptional regulator [Mycobacterium malmoense]|uniref:MarR family transcriptional regulator n=1 Tax=Mycobacterium malmoense TaxID=1780 RepID=A0ABX3SMJ8_MYCMA|nr:MarR family transcriptional regulator [Mycobacterium malmoense]ORA79262.1 MarR family transcriptional regulator [Mycobacterium malmoense]QZA18212.1 MarR family transcriptional regulator [Mycobacterium malmoense]UNB94986.1 MarR family transcriptional regulator [Mycobacterium malmoense]
MDGIGVSAVTAARDLRVLFSRLRRRLRDLAIDDDLTPSQTAVLTRLWKEGTSSASALAGAERVRPQSMATIVAALEQRGLIERTPDPEDGRRQVISLTTEGRRRAESDRRVREEWLARTIQERYSERERRVILDALSLLERLTEN